MTKRFWLFVVLSIVTPAKLQAVKVLVLEKIESVHRWRCFHMTIRHIYILESTRAAYGRTDGRTDGRMDRETCQ